MVGGSSSIFQSLPTYSHAFENDQRFLIFENDRYVFHYMSGTCAEKDLPKIVATQNLAFAKIIHTLRVPIPDKKIHYYFYPNEQVKTELMGDGWYAQSIYSEFRVHVLYTDTIQPIGPHEDTHLLTLPWGLAIGFFQEGLAEYMVGHAWDGTMHAQYVQTGYAQGTYKPLPAYLSHTEWANTDDAHALQFYSLAGSFSAYLIEKFGLETYKAFYMDIRRDVEQIVNAEKYAAHFREPVEETEKHFIQWAMKLNTAGPTKL